MMLNAWLIKMRTAWVAFPGERHATGAPLPDARGAALDHPTEAVRQAHWPADGPNWPRDRYADRRRPEAGTALGA